MAGLVTQTGYESMPPEVVNQAKLCVLDLVGVALAGANSELGRMALKLAQETGQGQESSVWGAEEKLPSAAAVFVNAMRGHIMDMDDGHRYSAAHMGVVTVPVAIALAERENLTGRELIEAVVIGYEIGVRLGTFINPGHLKRGFHTTATVGAFASAAVAAKILQLSQAQAENCFSLAGLQSAGLMEVLTSGQMGKSFQVGRAAQNGVWAAVAAKLGIEGPELAMEGADGFLNAYADGCVGGEGLFDNAGTPFQILSIYFKTYAACRHTHPALEAIEILRQRHHLRADEVVAVEVETYSVAAKLTGKNPPEASAIAAKFSMPLSIGLMLTFGEAGPGIYTDRNAAHPMVRGVADLVTIRTTSQRDSLYPGQRGAQVTIKTTGGSFTHEVNFPKGEPENPLDETELVNKFKINAGAIFEPEETEALAQCILNLENFKIKDLSGLLKSATKLISTGN
jgi:2-methylcitrate dehydratase PrpD